VNNIKLEPKLTSENKKIITKDWADNFPEFTIYKPMWLMRRHGPLLSGIVLDRSSGNDEYRPTSHVHCLARPSLSIYLTLYHRLASRRTGSEDAIRVRFHYDHAKEAADRMREQINFPVSGVLSFSDVRNAYYAYMNTPEGRGSQIRMYEDILAYYTWCGWPEQARTILDAYIPIVRSWDPAIMERDGGSDGWYDKCLALIADPDAVRLTVEEEVRKHKLKKIPDEGFNCDEC